MDETRKALIVASDNYTNPGLRRLRAPASDAYALAAVLRDPEIGGFEVRTLINEAAHVINLAVEDFFADRRPDDLLLVYFSGHGVKDEDGELYFAMSSTILGRLGATAVSAEFVSRQMNRSRSRRVVLLLDCCYAGAFERGLAPKAGMEMGIKERFGGGRGRAVITASSAMEYAFEAGELADDHEVPPSVFTSALVQGLSTGEADRDQDGLVGLSEMYDYVHDKVRAATPNQTPGMWTFGMDAEVYIARRSRPVTTPAPLPPGLQQAIDSPLAKVRAGAVQELADLGFSKHGGTSLAARLALEQLTDDDSRTVAAAATAALDALTEGPSPATTSPATIDVVPAVAKAASEPEATVGLSSGQGAGQGAGQASGQASGQPEKPSRSPRSRRKGRAIVGGAVAAVVGLAIAIIAIAGVPGRHGSPPPAGTDTAYGHLRWAFITKSWVDSSPAVVGGTVYVGSGDDSVYALDAANGHVRWSYATGGWVESSPVVAGGTVYVGSGDHKVYALDAATGRVRWSYTTGDYVYSSPAVVDGTVYIGSRDHKVYALDAATGRVRWTYTTRSWVNSSPVVVDGTMYVGSGDGNVYALDAATGTLRWSHATGGWVDSSPAVVDGTVYVGSRDGNVYALDAATGTLRWSHATGGYVYSSPAVAGGTVYVGSRDGNVYALDAATGGVLWSYATGGWVDSSPAVLGGTVYVGSRDGRVYALDAATGSVRGIFRTGDWVHSRPAVTAAAGTVYVSSDDHKVYAFSAAS